MMNTDEPFLMKKLKIHFKDVGIVSLGIGIFLFFWIWTHQQNGWYEFVLGDSLVQMLPGMVHNGREFFSGSIPFLNYHHFLGYESLLTGYYGGFYPLTYLSYGVSHYILGNDFWLLEVMAFFHMVVGLVGFYLLLRQYTNGRVIPFMSALSYVFSGIYLNLGTDWWFALAAMAYLPWLTYGIIRFLEDRTKRCLGRLLLVLALITSVGHLQMTVYAILYALCFGIVYRFANPLKGPGLNAKSWWWAGSLLLFIIMLNGSLFGFTRDAITKQGDSNAGYMRGIHLSSRSGLANFLLPPIGDNHDFSRTNPETLEIRWQSQWLSPLSFFNGLGVLGLIVLWALVFYQKIVLSRRDKYLLGALVLVSAVGLVMAYGYYPLYIWLAKMPLFSKLRHAAKHYVFASFYLSFLGGFVMIKLWEFIKIFRWKRGVAVVMLGLSFWALAFQIQSITRATSWFFSNEVLPLKGAETLPKEDLYVFVGIDNPRYPGNVLCGAGGYLCASLWGTYSYGGYETLLPKGYETSFGALASSRQGSYKTLDQAQYLDLRSKGVCHFMVNQAYQTPEALIASWGGNLESYQIDAAFSEGYYHLQDLDCLKMRDADSIIASKSYYGGGADFHLYERASAVVFTPPIYYLDRYRVSDQDGVSLKNTYENGRWIIEVPVDTEVISVRYSHPWVRLLWIWSWVVFLGWFGGFVRNFKKL